MYILPGKGAGENFLREKPAIDLDPADLRVYAGQISDLEGKIGSGRLDQKRRESAAAGCKRWWLDLNGQGMEQLLMTPVRDERRRRIHGKGFECDPGPTPSPTSHGERLLEKTKEEETIRRRRAPPPPASEKGDSLVASPLTN
ncbi:predicted protein [Arabidopsis lyrata subsp. lyrata]|uniref:Predicted protein n=1 Tax=Arabidopsis lyrata subsp. lyrata TaxID=81972 RepID=D7MNT9_ARALL|nr:predicted protein [Arabidopsis lyrata subsp. lyrata]